MSLWEAGKHYLILTERIKQIEALLPELWEHCNNPSAPDGLDDLEVDIYNAYFSEKLRLEKLLEEI